MPGELALLEKNKGPVCLGSSSSGRVHASSPFYSAEDWLKAEAIPENV